MVILKIVAKDYFGNAYLQFGSVHICTYSGSATASLVSHRLRLCPKFNHLTAWWIKTFPYFHDPSNDRDRKNSWFLYFPYRLQKSKNVYIQYPFWRLCLAFLWIRPLSKKFSDTQTILSIVLNVPLRICVNVWSWKTWENQWRKTRFVLCLPNLLLSLILYVHKVM